MKKVRFFIILIMVLLVVVFGGIAAWVPISAAADAPAAAGKTKDTWMLVAIATLLLFILGMVLNIYLRMNRLIKEAPEKENPFTLGVWWASLNQRLTKAVPVEQEEEIILDHEYDGIKELDNTLPPWWKWGFYVTIVVAIGYFVRFHVLGTGPTPEQEYNAEMKVAAAQLEAQRKNSGEMVDEKTVTMADAAGIAEGKQIFQKSCYMCHGSNGEGGVGPNLADEYWLHGGSINDVFKTIKYGVIDKGMQAWEKQFSPAEIKNLASFIKSIKGTKPANAKAPQGEVYTETAATTDSTAGVAKASVTSIK
jgi:cytochrome c oxidase cbb3-type subunit III